jgi:hypothetical protein
LTVQSFRTKPLFFQLALAKARDDVGRALGTSLMKLDARTLTFNQAARSIVDAADGAVAEALSANFAWREIIY